MAYEIEPGRTHPLGATPDAQGINFSIYSDSASKVELLLFEKHDDLEPMHVILLDPAKHRTFCFWHAYVRWLSPGIYYAFKVDGPRNLHEGHRFNPNKVLIDPYAKGVSTALWVRTDACGDKDNVSKSMRAAVIDVTDYDWEGDRPLKRSMNETIIYEMHVGGFTKSTTSKV
jgi:isoamylase